MQLGIFGWQMAAIKWEKDRAANTLLPNYNTYGRYDIPTYYESYWQSPEERFYTGLFVIQILCLIASFFLLFASIMLIYGVHTWSRFLVWPWFICMSSSILTSLAYCGMWWWGDVRDYWLVITLLEMFCVFLNCYCFVVIAAFYKQMNSELDYYEGGKRGYGGGMGAGDNDSVFGRPTGKYNRFVQERQQFTPPQPPPGRGTMGRGGVPPNEFFDSFEGGDGGNQQWVADDRWRQDEGRAGGRGQPVGYPTDFRAPAFGQQPVYMPEYPRQPYSPATQLQQPAPPRPRSVPPNQLLPGHTLPSAFDTEDLFKDVPRQETRRRSSSQRRHSHCRYCERRSRHRHHCRHCHHRHRSPHHHHHRSRDHHHRSTKASELCSSDGGDGGYSHTTESTLSTQALQKRLSEKRREDGGERERRDQGGGSIYDSRRKKPMPLPRAIPERDAEVVDLLSPPVPPPPFAGGFTIPHHIVIPPPSQPAHPLSDSSAERKYQIQSEITISYDPLTGRLLQAASSPSGSHRQPSHQQRELQSEQQPTRDRHISGGSTFIDGRGSFRTLPPPLPTRS